MVNIKRGSTDGTTAIDVVDLIPAFADDFQQLLRGQGDAGDACVERREIVCVANSPPWTHASKRNFGAWEQHTGG